MFVSLEGGKSGFTVIANFSGCELWRSLKEGGGERVMVGEEGGEHGGEQGGEHGGEQGGEPKK